MDAPQLSDALTAEIVLGWFKEEWSGEAQYPDMQQCRDVRSRLQTVMAWELGQARALNPLKSAALKAKSEALKAARGALRSVPQLRQALQDEIDKYSFPAGESIPWPPRDSAVLALTALERAEADLRIVKETLDASQPVTPNPARFVADSVRLAWRNTGAKVPLSATEGSPMTGFVQCALKSIGMDYGDHAIIAAIKGRRLMARRSGNSARGRRTE